MNVHISVVMTLHAEGWLVHRTLKALLDSTNRAKQQGLLVEVIAVLDKVTDNHLEATVSSWSPEFDGLLRTCKVEYGSLSLSRNHGIAQSSGKFISILDGDDLYGEQWLLNAYKVCASEKNSIAHPELYYSYPFDPFIVLFNNDPLQYLDLMQGNQWSALSMAHRDVFQGTPYVKDNDHYAYQDWLWNCETIVKGCRHVIVPQTVMAIRQKIPGKSLWQTSFARNRVIRPNHLFRNFFLMKYSEYLPKKANDRTLLKILSFPKSLCISFYIKFFEYLARRHNYLYDQIVGCKRRITKKVKARLGIREIPVSAARQFEKLLEIEPALQDYQSSHIRKSNRTLKFLKAISPEMSALVKAQNSKIFLLGNLSNHESNLYSLYYMHAIGSPVFVITTETSDNAMATLLPADAVHIDIGNCDLTEDEKVKFLHRLLLEASFEFIHIFHSKISIEMLSTYAGTFKNKRIFGSFNEINTSLFDVFSEWHKGLYEDIDNLFNKLSTNSLKIQEYLVKIFGLPPSFVLHYQAAFSPKLFSKWFDYRKAEHSGIVTNLKINQILNCICFGNVNSRANRMLLTKVKKRLQRRSVQILFHAWGSRKLNLLRHSNVFSTSIFSDRLNGGENSIDFSNYDIALQLDESDLNPIVIHASGWGIPAVFCDELYGDDPIRNELGWIASKRTAPDSLTEIFVRFLDEPHILAKMGERAKQYICNNHSWDTFLKHADEFYRI